MLLNEFLGTTAEALETEDVFNTTLGLDSGLFLDPALIRIAPSRIFRQAHISLCEEFSQLLRDLKQSRVDNTLQALTPRLACREPKFAGVGTARKTTAGRGISPKLAYDTLEFLNTIPGVSNLPADLFELLPAIKFGFGPDALSDWMITTMPGAFFRFSQEKIEKLGVTSHIKQTIVQRNTFYDLVYWDGTPYPTAFIPRSTLSKSPQGSRLSLIPLSAESKKTLKQVFLDFSDSERSWGFLTRVGLKNVERLFVENLVLLPLIYYDYKAACRGLPAYVDLEQRRDDFAESIRRESLTFSRNPRGVERVVVSRAATPDLSGYDQDAPELGFTRVSVRSLYLKDLIPARKGAVPASMPHETIVVDAVRTVEVAVPVSDLLTEHFVKQLPDGWVLLSRLKAKGPSPHDVVKCKRCRESFSRHALAAHEADCTGAFGAVVATESGVSFKPATELCKRCGHRFPMGTIDEHRVLCHGASKAKSRKVEMTSSLLDRNERGPAQLRVYPCPHCPKKYTMKGLFESHVSTCERQALERKRAEAAKKTKRAEQAKTMQQAAEQRLEATLLEAKILDRLEPLLKLFLSSETTPQCVRVCALCGLPGGAPLEWLKHLSICSEFGRLDGARLSPRRHAIAELKREALAFQRSIGTQCPRCKQVWPASGFEAHRVECGRTPTGGRLVNPERVAIKAPEPRAMREALPEDYIRGYLKGQLALRDISPAAASAIQGWALQCFQARHPGEKFDFMSLGVNLKDYLADWMRREAQASGGRQLKEKEIIQFQNHVFGIG